MTATRTARVPTRPTTTAANTLLQPSMSAWFAERKARRNAVAEPTPAPAPEGTATAGDDAADAVARWLTGGAGPTA